MNQGKVLVVCATRDRPYKLGDLIRSLLDTSEKADLAIYIDDDQDALYPLDVPDRVRRHVGPRVGPCVSLNELVKAHPGYEAYGAATDDSTFATPGWDQWVLAQVDKFPGRVGVMSPFHRAPTPVMFSYVRPHIRTRMDFPWATRRWIEALGWFTHPDTYSFYWDVIVEVLGIAAGVIAYASEKEFEMDHDMNPSINGDKVSADAKAAILALAMETPGYLKRIRESMNGA
ncbi:MAG TPA: hypothetical protein VJM10_02360 [Candidatus Methylomirabilis sp.]|nr:hypothetical protein [Candidatus Methylomirabilis sp.]